MTDVPKRRGRPPKAAGTRAEPRIDLRLSESQHERYEAAARAAGYTTTDSDGVVRVLTAAWARDQLDAVAAGGASDGSFERGVAEGLARARMLIGEAMGTPPRAGKLATMRALAPNVPMASEKARGR